MSRSISIEAKQFLHDYLPRKPNVEITEVNIRPFNEIDEEFAFEYGEGDRTLTWWRKAMWRYFSDQCADLGLEPIETMPIVCCRFRLLHLGSGVS